MTRRPTKLNCAVALATVVFAFSGGASGQDVPAKEAGAKASSAVLTPAQLRECVSRKERLQKQSEAAAVARSEVDAQKADLDKLEGELKAEIATIDRTSEEAVNAFNAKVARRDRLVETYQTRIDAYNADHRNAKCKMQNANTK